ncbi:MAG: DUF2797 domain-containing protein [Thiothrix sp.]|nr:DUF2797 domain-containing protein [Thiothrix sp.]HPQ96093.1 DUF2797 domain-containing protein [Thiolinea sp.]
MQKTGHLRKMKTGLTQPVSYHLILDDDIVPLSPRLGTRLKLTHTGVIHCIHCGRLTRKSFNQGYCYPCFTRLAECDSCIIKPELCHFDQGTCRDPAWAQQHCMQPHYVYLANSSGVKVGITRASQIPVRWMDQGATQALPILRVASRYLSGLVEVALKQYVADKTQWQRMLKGPGEPVALPQQRDVLLARVAPELAALRARFGAEALEVLDEPPVTIEYPVLQYPLKVKAFNLDRDPVLEGTLQGIKGQYLLLDTGVINIRKYGGYEVEVVLEGEA